MNDSETLNYALNYHENNCREETCPAVDARQALSNIIKRAEAAEARATEQDKTIIALCDERDELRRQLEQAQRVIAEQQALIGSVVKAVTP